MILKKSLRQQLRFSKIDHHNIFFADFLVVFLVDQAIFEDMTSALRI